MKNDSEKYTATFKFLMESDRGVQQIAVGVLDHQPFNILRVIETTPLSGATWQVSPQQMFRALKLHVWAEENPDVFVDGRVSQ